MPLIEVPHDAVSLRQALDPPGSWCALEDSPVVAVRSAPGDGLLLLATPRRVVAVGDDGPVWRTPRLAIEGLHLGEQADGKLPGIADPCDDAAGE